MVSFSLRRLNRLGFVFCVLLCLVAAVGAAQAPATPAPQLSPDSVIAIGDIHGDFDDFIRILQRAGLIDEQHNWSGGKATFVQCGDEIDRGPKVREVMDFLMAFPDQAAKAGGRVVLVLGNHEVMNMMGDLRYVTPQNYASFAGADSEKRRKAAFEDYEKWYKRNAHIFAKAMPPITEMHEAEWMASHPAGFLEQRDAFGPSGQYGKWLRKLPAVAQVGKIAFMHGGIHPSLTSMSLDTINSRVHEELRNFDDIKQYLVSQKLILPYFTLQEIADVVRAEAGNLRNSPGLADASRDQEVKMLQEFMQSGNWVSMNLNGPLWFRGYDSWSDEEGASEISKVLEKYHLDHIVVGHTVQRTGRIRNRFGNKVFLIDTGMLSSYYPGGRASALNIQDEKFSAEYLDQPQPTPLQ